MSSPEGPSAAPATNTPLVANYVTAMLKGQSGNRFALKGGDAQSGSLATKYDGARPAGYSPMKKEGAIVLGIGGDNSHTGEGTFFEGCMTAGVPAGFRRRRRAGQHRRRGLRPLSLWAAADQELAARGCASRRLKAVSTSSIETGFVMWLSKPASNARRVSSACP